MGHIATRIDSPTTHRLIGLATLLGAALMLCLGALSSPTSAAAATPSVLTFPLCTAQGNQWHPAVSGNNVVWYDSRNGATTLYAYDLSTKTEFLIGSAWCPTLRCRWRGCHSRSACDLRRYRGLGRRHPFPRSRRGGPQLGHLGL